MKKWLVGTILSLIVLYLFFMYSPFLVDVQVKPYSNPFRNFTGPLEENYRLNEADRLFLEDLQGPESIVFHEGYLYTGLLDGRIVKIRGGKITTVARTGTACALPYEELKCGRPLGMRKGNDGLLYFCDAVYGIFTMNFTTGELTNILPSSVHVEGQPLTFPDDLDIDDQGNVYFTDASSKWDLSTYMFSVFENESGGRVIRYNIHSGQTEVLAKNLNFINGIQLSKSGKSLLLSEVTQRRILRLYIKGEAKGKVEVFVDALPGEPDNIRPSSRGYWVALSCGRNSSNPLIRDRISEWPNFKRFYLRVHIFFTNLLLKLSELVDNFAFRAFAYKLKRADWWISLHIHNSIVIELDEDGQILRSFHSPDGKIALRSEAREHDGYLYLGSFWKSSVGRFRL